MRLPTIETATATAAARSTSRSASRLRTGRAEARAAPRSKATVSHARPATSVATIGRRGHDRAAGHVRVGDRQQAPEEQGVGPHPGIADVAHQHGPQGDGGREHDGHRHPLGELGPLPQAGEAERQGERGDEGGAEHAPARQVGDDERGEGGVPEGVGEEGQAAQDDPGAEQAGRNGQQQHLDQRTAHEVRREGVGDEAPEIGHGAPQDGTGSAGVRLLGDTGAGRSRRRPPLAGSRPRGTRWRTRSPAPRAARRPSRAGRRAGPRPGASRAPRSGPPSRRRRRSDAPGRGSRRRARAGSRCRGSGCARRAAGPAPRGGRS